MCVCAKTIDSQTLLNHPSNVLHQLTQAYDIQHQPTQAHQVAHSSSEYRILYIIYMYINRYNLFVIGFLLFSLLYRKLWMQIHFYPKICYKKKQQIILKTNKNFNSNDDYTKKKSMI